MLTRNKKSYAGYLVAREGRMVTNPDEQLDIKGMDIKKVKTNVQTRDYFQNVLKTMILGMGDAERRPISLPRIVGAFADYEAMVRESLRRGEMTFAKPVKFSGEKAYQFPYRMEAFRGTLVWNDVYPGASIRTLEYVNMFKTTADTVEKFDAIVESGGFSEEDLAILEKVKLACFGNKEMLTYGFSRACIPRREERVPSWVLPFIDEAAIVEDNVKTALILLESLGVRCVTVRGSSKFTNIVEF
jgi:hypothetical protein